MPFLFHHMITEFGSMSTGRNSFSTSIQKRLSLVISKQDLWSDWGWFQNKIYGVTEGDFKTRSMEWLRVISNKIYGVTVGDFKTRWRNHKTSFTNASYNNVTELSHYIWELRNKHGISYDDINISWGIEQRSSKYKCGTRRCDLCLSEKTIIAMAERSSLLNRYRHGFGLTGFVLFVLSVHIARKVTLMNMGTMTNSDSKLHGANMGHIWGRRDPGGPHVGPMNFCYLGNH